MTELRWVTVNVLETADLEDGSFRLAHTEHEALKHIVSKLRKECWLYVNGSPRGYQVRIWGAREVEPLMQADGSVIWKLHLHMIVYLDGLPADSLAEALRMRWKGNHAVRIDKVRGASTKSLQRSLKKLGSYPVKARFTYLRPDGMREWLSAEVVDQLARWMVARGSRWSRFALGSRKK